MNNRLDEIIAQEYGCKNIDEVLRDFDVSPKMIKQCMLKAMKMILEEAAENATIDSVNMGSSEFQTVVDKQSITDTLNKYL